MWAGGSGSGIVVDDRFRAGGREASEARTDEAVAVGWRFGLPLDPAHTGRAFAAPLDHCVTRAQGRGRGTRQQILFWHTGGLMDLIAGSG